MEHNRKHLETFWYWISERHKVYIRRFIKGEPKPWTNDTILQQYRFTNVFRTLDKGTIWLVDNVIEPHKNDNELLLFNIILYRQINLIETAEAIGYITKWDPDTVIKLLKERKAQGYKIFTSAYMLTGYGYEDKIDTTILMIMDPIWTYLNHIWEELPDTIEGVTKYFDGNFYGFGGFLAYEVATDLTYTPKLKNAPDMNTWANRGPGALRGADYIFGEYMNVRKEVVYLDCLRWLLAQTNEHFKGSHVPSLTIRDIEHSLCEVSKYAKVLEGTGRPRQRFDGFPEPDKRLII